MGDTIGSVWRNGRVVAWVGCTPVVDGESVTLTVVDPSTVGDLSIRLTRDALRSLLSRLAPQQVPEQPAGVPWQQGEGFAELEDAA